MLKGFLPIIGENPTILILGSMPSVKSLEEQEYYAHPTNRFWRILGELYSFEFTSYNDKINFLKMHQIALWDVIASCEREGSLDSQIKHVCPNDIIEILRNNPTIHTIYCNGRKAYELLSKHFPELKSITKALPSTSSANQSKSYSLILEEWSVIHNDK